MERANGRTMERANGKTMERANGKTMERAWRYNERARRQGNGMGNGNIM